MVITTLLALAANFAPVSLPLATLLIVAGLLFSLKRLAMDTSTLMLMAVGLIYVATVLALAITLEYRPMSYAVKTIFPILALSIFMQFRFTVRQCYLFFAISYFVFLFDFSFSFSALVFGTDMFGRGLGVRPGDTFGRFIGFWGNPFLTINFAVLALIYSLIAKRPLLALLPLLALIINGSQKAPLALCLIVYFSLLLKVRPRITPVLISGVVIVSLIVIATYYASGPKDFVTGNQMRIHAWTLGITKLSMYPLFGFPFHLTGDVQVATLFNIDTHGNAESFFLQVGLDFGVLPMLLLPIFFSGIVAMAIQNYKRVYNPITFMGAVVASFVLVNMFYGTFFGNFNTMLALIMLLRSPTSPKHETTANSPLFYDQKTDTNRSNSSL